jgi:hypothetical protein
MLELNKEQEKQRKQNLYRNYIGMSNVKKVENSFVNYF